MTLYLDLIWLRDLAAQVEPATVNRLVKFTLACLCCSYQKSDRLWHNVAMFCRNNEV